MRLPRMTTRRWMALVAVVALGFGIFVSCVRWIQYPRIEVAIFNETPTPIYDLRVNFLYGVRTAEQLRPGGVAVTEIQSGGDGGIFFCYRDSGGICKNAEPLYEESGERGFLEVHVTNEGARLINGIYSGYGGIPFMGIRRVRPAGQMTLNYLGEAKLSGCPPDPPEPK
jgi:hypothetical protein